MVKAITSQLTQTWVLKHITAEAFHWSHKLKVPPQTRASGEADTSASNQKSLATYKETAGKYGHQ